MADEEATNIDYISHEEIFDNPYQGPEPTSEDTTLCQNYLQALEIRCLSDQDSQTRPQRRSQKTETFRLQKLLASAPWTCSGYVERQEEADPVECDSFPISSITKSQTRRIQSNTASAPVVTIFSSK